MAEKKGPAKPGEARPGVGEDTKPVNREHERLLEWFRTVRFKRTLIGGINEVQLWKKLAELNEIYEAALRAERARYDALIEAFARSAGMSVTKYKGELAQADAKYSELSRRFAEYLVRVERGDGYGK
mgnify:FL=1